MAKINIANERVAHTANVGDLIVLRDYSTPARLIVKVSGKYGAFNPSTGNTFTHSDTLDGLLANYKKDIIRVIPSDKIEISEVV